MLGWSEKVLVIVAEPASESASNLCREANSDTCSEAGELDASVSVSGMMKGNPEVRTSAYPSEERWVLEETRDDTLTGETLGMDPNECALRLCLFTERSGPDATRKKDAEAGRFGGTGRLVGRSWLICHTPKGWGL